MVFHRLFSFFAVCQTMDADLCMGYGMAMAMAQRLSQGFEIGLDGTPCFEPDPYDALGGRRLGGTWYDIESQG